MSQTLFLPTPTLPTFTPSSPDPTPLRMLAFSVAEAALQPDPNSPFLDNEKHSSPKAMKRNARWSGGDWVSSWTSKSAPKASLWELVERAKDRKAPPPPVESPPISPATYNFVLPPNSPLAASVQREEVKDRSPRRPVHLSLLPRFPMETRSAEPSPTKSTFSSLDQSRPPPVFVPRLTGKEFSVRSRQVSSGKHTRTKSVDGGEDSVPPKPRGRLPSLAQIQAKMRTASGPGAVPMPRPTSMRSDSEDSFELQTPTEERPSLAILARRPPTPPTPPAAKDKVVEPRLAPFLRERTSGRLAMATPPRVIKGLNHPVLKITPPSKENRPPAVVSLNSPSPTKAYFPSLPAISPTESRFSLAVHTPPPQSTTQMGSPVSPAGSMRSSASASPTLSVPRITCTPAPAKVVKDGVEQDSDEEEDEVVVFDGEAEEAKEREERERMGQQMRDILRMRRPSE